MVHLHYILHVSFVYWCLRADVMSFPSGVIWMKPLGDFPRLVSVL